MKQTKIDAKSRPEHLSVELQQIANEDPIVNSKRRKPVSSKKLKQLGCPSDKEINPRTNRCINKCKTGFVRDHNFKCRKTKKIPTIKTKRESVSPAYDPGSYKHPLAVSPPYIPSPDLQVKKCPSDKELNPKSGRCIKKCKPGTIRNKKFQCRKKNHTYITFNT
jgi:hypothetical protein